MRPVEEAKQMAMSFMPSLVAGADFAELASEYCEDPGSKENGGFMPCGGGSMGTGV